MNLDYIDVSKFCRVGKGRMYEREAVVRNPLLPKPTPRLVPQQQIFVTLRSEMEATSHIGLEVRTVIGDNLPSSLVGVDVGMNRHRA